MIYFIITITIFVIFIYKIGIQRINNNQERIDKLLIQFLHNFKSLNNKAEHITFEQKQQRLMELITKYSTGIMQLLEIKNKESIDIIKYRAIDCSKLWILYFLRDIRLFFKDLYKKFLENDDKNWSDEHMLR